MQAHFNSTQEWDFLIGRSNRPDNTYREGTIFAAIWTTPLERCTVNYPQASVVMDMRFQWGRIIWLDRHAACRHPQTWMCVIWMKLRWLWHNKASKDHWSLGLSKAERSVDRALEWLNMRAGRRKTWSVTGHWIQPCRRPKVDNRAKLMHVRFYPRLLSIFRTADWFEYKSRR